MTFTPVYVVWVDSCRRDGWHFTEDLPETAAIECETIGYLIEDGDEAIRVSSSVGEDPATGDTEVLSDLTIPKCAIRKMRDVSIGYAETEP